VYGIIKAEWLKAHTEFKDWREVTKRLKGESLTAGRIGRMGKQLQVEIPLYTPTSKLAKDGRSRENRRKKR
jgi:hypothetical protein